MIIQSGALFDRFGSFRVAAGVEAQPVFGIVGASGTPSDLTGRSIVWRFLDAHSVVVGAPIAATVNGATASFAFTGVLTEALRKGGVTSFEIAMLTATGRVVLHSGTASIDDGAPFLVGVAGAAGADTLTVMAGTGTLIVSAQGAPGSSTEAIAAAAVANAAAADSIAKTAATVTATGAANAATADCTAKTALAVTATGKADTATAAAKVATDDSVAKTALTVIAGNAANAGATAANNAAAQIVPEGGPSLLIKPGTGTFPAIADAYFAGRKSLYSGFDGLRRQLRGFADVTDFARATAATSFDAAGALQTAPSGTARLGYDPTSMSLRGLLVEGQATNALVNNTMQGASVGTPGTLPTGWAVGVPNGMSFAVAGVGAQNGVDYIDVRISGTPTVNGNFQINPPSTTAQVNEIWTSSLFGALVAGSNPPNTILNLNETSSGAYLGGTTIPFLPTATLTRFAVTRAIAFASAISTRGYIQANVVAGTPYDVTYRIGLPQLEKGSSPSSPIRTTTAQVTRAGDLLTKALGTEFNPAAQTALFRLFFDRSPVDTVTKAIWIWDDGTLVNRIGLLLGTDGKLSLQSRNANADITIAGPVLVAGTEYKVAIGFGGGVLRLNVNGVSYQTAVAVSPAGLTFRRIGSSTANQPNCFIMPYLPHPTNPLLDATEFPRLLTVAEMQAYTA